MNTNEILQAQFNTYVAMARILKDKNIITWTVYIFRAKTILDQINENKTKKIDMSEFLKIA